MLISSSLSYDLLDIYSKPLTTDSSYKCRVSFIISHSRYWWVWFHCLKYVLTEISPELEGVRSWRFKCTVSIGKSIGGMSFVHCIVFRGCPLFRGSVIIGFTIHQY